MKFGPTPLAQAEGAILAHSHALPGGGRLKKGARLGATEIALLAQAGVSSVVAARLEAGDMAEDPAASAIAAALTQAAGGVSASAAFTGRANLHASRAGLFTVDPGLVAAVNAIDEAVTLATIPSFEWVQPRRMLATVKIIPYGAPEAAVRAACDAILEAGADARPEVRPPARRTARLILTRTEGMSDRLIESGREIVARRLERLGVVLESAAPTAHETGAVADALSETPASADLLLVLAASATSDRRDVIPAAIEAAGGRVERLGMPVDPGNLLVLGGLGERPVLGLPGCARSPALNGADWVLERLVAGAPVSSADIAAMGAGGLLKEIASRPSPREARRSAGGRPFISAILLAAGGSSRFGDGRHKLLEEIGGAPLVRRSAQRLLAARGASVDEVVAVVGAREAEMRAALEGLDVKLVPAPLWREGMAASLRAGLAAASSEADAALVALADMPDVGPDLIHRLAAAFDASEGREIIRPTRAGKPGHPVLFGRRFFEALASLEGDVGARAIISAHADHLVEIDAETDAPLTDLDTQDAFRRYLEGRRAQT